MEKPEAHKRLRAAAETHRIGDAGSGPPLPQRSLHRDRRYEAMRHWGEILTGNDDSGAHGIFTHTDQSSVAMAIREELRLPSHTAAHFQ